MAKENKYKFVRLIPEDPAGYAKITPKVFKCVTVFMATNSKDSEKIVRANVTINHNGINKEQMAVMLRDLSEEMLKEVEGEATSTPEPESK